MIRLTQRWLRIALVVIALGIALWTVLVTEMRVSELRERGFTDVVISSTRNHAYFPLIGGYAGALIFVLVGRGIRRLIKPDQRG